MKRLHRLLLAFVLAGCTDAPMSRPESPPAPLERHLPGSVGTDYDVRIGSSGSFFRRRWRVESTTQETKISQEILDQWVTWMVAAGGECGCDFDGWGTSSSG
jgi:hypothetical protein